jgi:selenocysteine lyase/cysteine desulfurase
VIVSLREESVVSSYASLNDFLARREEEFPIFRDTTYLNTAAMGVLPARSAAVLAETAQCYQFPSTAKFNAMPNYHKLATERLAHLIGADPSEIAFTNNTTHGTNIFAQGIEWRPGDNVIIPAIDFPSFVVAWYHLQARGVEVRRVKYADAGPTAAELLAAADSRTRAIACSGITWNTGWQVDMEALGQGCKERGILFIIDGTQVVGAQNIDVKALQLSGIALHNYKWTFSGFGAGAIYVAPDALDRIQPTFIGESAIKNDVNTLDGPLVWRDGAARYTAGGGGAMPLAALATSLGLHSELGIAAIEEYSRHLADIVRNGVSKLANYKVVSSADPAHRSSIVVFTTGSAAGDEAMVQKLATQGIIVAMRAAGIRAAMHVYNTEEDVAHLLEALA